MQLRYLIALFVGLVAASLSDITLKPARRGDAHLKRSNEFVLANRVELTYGEEPGVQNGGIVYESQFSLCANSSILLLEDFDHLLRDVRCSDSVMTITMRDNNAYKSALKTCEALTNGVLVSSHFSCSENDKHSFYKVLGFEADENISTIRIALESHTFDKLFESMTFHLGRASEPHTVHQHDRLFKRQATAEPTTTTSSEISMIIDDPTDSTTTTSESATSTAPREAIGTYVRTMPLNFEDTNASFLDFLDLPIDFGCKNCSSFGELIVTSVDLSLNDLFNFTDDDPIKTGSLQFDLKGFGLSIGLRAVPSEDIDELIPIFTTPRFGLNIGFFSAGIDFGVGINILVETANVVELGFGFDVAVPDSTLRIDVAEFEDSYIKGLNETKVTAKLLESNSSNVDISLVATLQPAITFGISLGPFRLGAGPYMDLPKLNLTASQLDAKEFGANCEADGESDDKFKDEFTNLTHVEYNVDLTAGLRVDLLLFHPKAEFVNVDIANTTQCLVWKTEGSMTQFAPATAVLASITAPPSAPSGAGGLGEKKNAAARLGAVSLDFFGLGARGVVLVLCAVVAFATST